VNNDLYTLVADLSLEMLCASFAFLYTGSSNLRQLPEPTEELDPAALVIGPKSNLI